MAIILICAWLGLLQILVKTGVLKGWALWMKLSPIALYVLYFLIIAIPMNFTAPTGAVVALRQSVQISPAVPGVVTAVPVTSGTAIPPDTVLFEIDAEPYAAAVAALEAQAELAAIRLDQAEELVARGSGREADVQQYRAELARVEANLRGAEWNLEQTRVRAPAEGFVPHVALEPGTQVSPQRSVMTFVQTADVALAGQIDQAYARHIRPGQKADVVLKLFPGAVLPATVNRVLALNEAGQMTPSGVALGAEPWRDLPFVVELDVAGVDPAELPAGAYGTVAIYTSDMSSFGELIRAIMLRTETWLNYL